MGIGGRSPVWDNPIACCWLCLKFTPVYSITSPSYSYYIPILSPLYRHFGWFCTPTLGPFLVSCRVRPRKNAIAEGESVGSAPSCKLGRWVTCLVHPRNSRADSGGELSHVFTVFTMVRNVSAITSLLQNHSFICPPSCHQTLVSWKSTIDIHWSFSATETSERGFAIAMLDRMWFFTSLVMPIPMRAWKTSSEKLGYSRIASERSTMLLGKLTIKQWPWLQ